MCRELPRPLLAKACRGDHEPAQSVAVVGERGEQEPCLYRFSEADPVRDHHTRHAVPAHQQRGLELIRKNRNAVSDCCQRKSPRRIRRGDE